MESSVGYEKELQNYIDNEKAAVKLANYVGELLYNKGIELVWLNARINASGFYRKMGYKTTGDHFNIKGIGTHQQFFKMINR